MIRDNLQKTEIFQTESIIGTITKIDEPNKKVQITYEIDDKQYSLDLDKLLPLTDPQDFQLYYQQNKKYIHFYDVSNSDLNHINGVCYYLCYEKPTISKGCYDYDPCERIGFIINDSWGIYPELHDYDCFVQNRYILKLLYNLGYTKRYEMSIKDYQLAIDHMFNEEDKKKVLDIWPQYSLRTPGTIGILCVDQAFKKDKLLIGKIDCYYKALREDYQAVFDDLAEDTTFFDKRCRFKNPKFYILQDGSDIPYITTTPGQFGGHYKLKIYGRLDCPSAKRYIEKGQYVRYRVFFEDEGTAKTAGYRPCGVCMKEEYRKWKATNLL